DQESAVLVATLAALVLLSWLVSGGLGALPRRARPAGPAGRRGAAPRGGAGWPGGRLGRAPRACAGPQAGPDRGGGRDRAAGGQPADRRDGGAGPLRRGHAAARAGG